MALISNKRKVFGEIIMGYYFKLIVSFDFVLFEVGEVKVVHSKDLNKKMLIALVVASTLLGEILLLLSCFLICRLKILKKCNAKRDLNSDAGKGMSLSTSLDKFSSLKSGGKKGSPTAAIEYQLLVSATKKKFDDDNVIGKDAGGQEAERELEDIVFMANHGSWFMNG